VVEKGNGIGSSINFPTANIKVENKWKILPKDGVYAVKVFVENQQYFGMLNIGSRPTIADDKHVVEVHIFDFNSTIYNLDIKVEFIKRIRSEKKFNSLEELQSQLEIDESKIKAVFNLLR
jgi:riboflavin kinase/FMN adenylyltransferase